MTRQESVLYPVNIKTIFIEKLAHIVSAEPASARTSSATMCVSEEQTEDEGAQDLQPIQGSCATQEANIHTRTQDLTPETEPPLQKKAKRGTGEEEQEEGEIVDSSDEEEETSNRDQCLSNYLPGDASTCRERAEVTVTEKNPVDETECVLTHHIQVGNDSAAASDSCQME